MKKVSSITNIIIEKVEINLVAVGRAPKLKMTRFKLKKSHTF